MRRKGIVGRAVWRIRRGSSFLVLPPLAMQHARKQESEQALLPNHDLTDYTRSPNPTLYVSPHHSIYSSLVPSYIAELSWK